MSDLAVRKAIAYSEELGRAADDAANHEPQMAARITRVSDVQAERVEWLWPGRIAMGKVCVLDGDPGLGKSTVTLDIAARASTGSPMPDGHALAAPMGVLLLSAEDGIADTIRPRLESHGAVLDRIHVLEGIGDRPWTTNDVSDLRDAITAKQAKLVIIDPLMAYLEGNAHRDQEVRKALHPITRLADELAVAILVVRHLNKGGGGNAVYRGGGSIGIIGAARTGLLIQTDPNDETGRLKVLAVSKCNLAEMAPSLAYHVETDQLRQCGRIVWDGPSQHTADSLLVSAADEERSAMDEAVDFLHAYIGRTRQLAKDVKDAARRQGINDGTLARAKKPAGITTEREGFGPGSRVWWVLKSASIDDKNPIDDKPHELAPMASMAPMEGSVASRGDTVADEDEMISCPL